jgi:hypothetical protein
MTLWAYLLVFSDDVGTTKDVHDFVDSHPSIVNWYRWMPNSFVLVSPLTAKTLSDSFHEKFKGRFVIMDTDTDRNGWLPKEVWDLMKRPRGVSQA